MATYAAAPSLASLPELLELVFLLLNVSPCASLPRTNATQLLPCATKRRLEGVPICLTAKINVTRHILQQAQPQAIRQLAKALVVVTLHQLLLDTNATATLSLASKPNLEVFLRKIAK